MIKSDSQTRRVRITKRMLKDALMELLEKKGLSSVSITELCQLAEVNRSTFYSYYNNVGELLKETEDDLIARIPAAKAGDTKADYTTGKLEDFTAFFAYIRHHSRDFSILLQYGRANFIDRLMCTVMEHFPEMASGEKNPLQIHLGYVFAISGVVGIMSEWIQNDFPMSDRVFAEYALQMCLRANDFPAEL